MSKRRTGLPSMAYMGVEASSPPQLTVVTRAPTVNDYAGYNLGHIWLYDTGVAGTEQIWMLVDKRAHVSTWIRADGGGGAGTFPCDAGQAVAAVGITNIFGGWNINTTGAGNTVTVFLDTSIHQPVTSADGTAGVYYLGSAVGVGGNTFLHGMGTQNTFVGQSAGNLGLTVANAVRNTGQGFQVLQQNVDGNRNSAFGDSALATIVDGDRNCAFGAGNLDLAQDLDFNTSVGCDGLTQLLTGDYNTTLGYRSGFNYVAAESSNILIGHEGILGDDNIIRIGTDGVGAGQQDNTFIAGIYGSAVGADNQVVLVANNGEMGSSRGTDGQLLIGATGAAPIWANLVSGDGSVTFALGANAIDVRAPGGGGGGGATTFITDVAGPAVIAGANITMTGDGIIRTDGTVINTVTFEIPDQPNGEVLIGGGGGGLAWSTLTPGAGINIVEAANTITISAPGAGGGSTTFNTDVAGPAIVVAGNIDIFGGANITTTGGGQTVTVDLDDSITLPDTNVAGTEGVYALASGTTFMHNRGAAGTSYNTFLGEDAGNLAVITTAVDSTGIGYESLNSLDDGTGNSCFGSGSGRDITSGVNNTSGGLDSATHISTGGSNCTFGANSFNGIVAGSNNIGLGTSAGSNCTAGDSSNILIGNIGNAGLNNTIKIGTQGAGAGQQDTTFIHGIYNVAPGGGGLQGVTIDANGQLGSYAGGAGPINTVVAGDNINLTGTAFDPIINLDETIYWPDTNLAGTQGVIYFNTERFLHKSANTTGVFLGRLSGRNPDFGTNNNNGANNVVIGNEAGRRLGGMAENTLVGGQSGYIGMGPRNTGIGMATLQAAFPTNCTAVGYDALSPGAGTSPTGSVAVGYSSGGQFWDEYNIALGYEADTGGVVGPDRQRYNICIGYQAGNGAFDNAAAPRVGINSNVFIANSGEYKDNNTIRIGTDGAGVNEHNRFFAAGIYDVDVPGDAESVYINANGQMGTGDIQQTAFLAIQDLNAPNVTGDGTRYTLGTLTPVDEEYDVTNDYDEGGGGAPATFTAPTDGLYFLEMQVLITGLVLPPPAPPPPAADPVIDTTIRDYQLINSVFQEQLNGQQSYFYNAVCDMDAADTAVFHVEVGWGPYTQTLDVGPDQTFISGYIVRRVTIV